MDPLKAAKAKFQGSRWEEDEDGKYLHVNIDGSGKPGQVAPPPPVESDEDDYGPTPYDELSEAAKAAVDKWLSAGKIPSPDELKRDGVPDDEIEDVMDGLDMSFPDDDLTPVPE